MTIKTASTGGDKILQKAFYMNATASIDEAGRVTLETHTFNHMKLIGFHGSAVAHFLDSNGTSLYTEVAGPYGVDGTWVGNSDRRDTVYSNVDPSLYLKVDKIDVYVGETPKNTFLPWLNNHLGDIVKILSEIFGSSSDGNEGSGQPIKTSAQGLISLNSAEDMAAARKSVPQLTREEARRRMR